MSPAMISEIKATLEVAFFKMQQISTVFENKNFDRAYDSVDAAIAALAQTSVEIEAK